MTKTTYVTLRSATGDDCRVGLTVDAACEYVYLTTLRSNLGGYRLDRFGPNPLTKTGRLKRSAIANVFTLAD